MAGSETVISIISIIIVIITGVFLFLHLYKIRTENNERIQSVVDQINDAQYYGYKYDKKQNENIKNIDDNVLSVYQSHEKLQNNVRYLDEHGVKKEDIRKQLDTQLANVDQINTAKLLIANGTAKNNIVIEGGRTSDGLNEGLSSINFNGYTQNGEKLINPKKSHWKITSDQRGDQDAMTIDNISKEGNLANYLWLSDGSVGLNNNKLKISNKWSGWPDTNPDKAEIANDVNDFKQLMIVGNKSSGERKVGVWDKLEIHGDQETTGTIKGNEAITLANNGTVNVLLNKDGLVEGSRVTGRNELCAGTACMNQGDVNKVKSNVPIIPDNNGVATLPFNLKTLAIQPNNPGPMIEKMYNSFDQRYGIGQFPAGTMRMYTGANGTSTANLSLAKADGTFDDILTIKTDRSTNIKSDLVVNGNLYTASGTLSGSDVRLKKNIMNLPDEEIAKLRDLDPKQYVYKDDPKARTQFGLIAQDVERLYPNLVETGPNGMKNIRYQDLIPILIAKVNKLENEIQ